MFLRKLMSTKQTVVITLANVQKLMAMKRLDGCVSLGQFIITGISPLMHTFTETCFVSGVGETLMSWVFQILFSQSLKLVCILYIVIYCSSAVPLFKISAFKNNFKL